jgi:class 3 adenylate cyclase
MHKLLNQFFDLALAEVHRYGGTINQFLGDGFMALFGAPIAQEDHARRALLAAIAILQRMQNAEGDARALREVHLRMGLNTGMVVVGKIGDDLRMDYTAVGDTTHLAARLQSFAEPGTIRLSEATRRAADPHFTFRDLGRHTLKGVDVRVPVFEPLEVKQATEANAAPMDCCPSCAHEIVGSQKFCGECGACLTASEADGAP